MKFQKRPIIVEAMRFEGTFASAREVLGWMGTGEFVELGIGPGKPLGTSNHILVKTLEGDLHASPGDWIIKGLRGEFYPCKPDIFEATYDNVED